MNAQQKRVKPVLRSRSATLFQKMLDCFHCLQLDSRSRGFGSFGYDSCLLLVAVYSFGGSGCSVTAAMSRTLSGTDTGTTLRNFRRRMLGLIKRGYVVRVGSSVSPRYVLSVYARDLLRPYL